jgi:hypothetical protein
LTHVEATQLAPEQVVVPMFAVGHAAHAPLQTR